MELKAEDEEERKELKETAESSIRAPEALLRPVPANPLSIFVIYYFIVTFWILVTVSNILLVVLLL